MQVRRVLTEEDAVSSTIGVVLMVAVTVVLAAAVGAFALDLAGETTKKTPSAAAEIEWGSHADGSDTVDVTIVSGDKMEAASLSITLGENTIWDDSGTSSSYTTYGEKKWDTEQIESGDTLGLKEKSDPGFAPGDTIKVVWNNGQKSQVLGSGTAD